MTSAGRLHRRTALLAFISSGVVVLVGVAILVSSLLSSVSSGWFVYAPLSGAVMLGPGAAIVPRSAVVGAVVLVVGLLALSLLFGYSLGRRHGSAPEEAQH